MASCVAACGILLTLLGVSAAASLTGSSIVEHPVIWSMPALSGANETAVLKALADLKSVPEVHSLSAGRLLKQVDGYTHALYARFPSFEALKQYYNARLGPVIVLMLPFIKKEYTVDYQTCLHPVKATSSAFHVTFVNVKNGTSENLVEHVLSSVRCMVSKLPSTVLQVTAGRNNYDRDSTFSHAFVVHLASGLASWTSPGLTLFSPSLEKAVQELYANSWFKKLLNHKLPRISERVLSIDFADYAAAGI